MKNIKLILITLLISTFAYSDNYNYSTVEIEERQEISFPIILTNYEKETNSDSNNYKTQDDELEDSSESHYNSTESTNFYED